MRRAYLELHIEQGPVLASLGAPAGAVVGTFGVERHMLRFVGQAAHAGSTPLPLRRDAFLAAAQTAVECRDAARRLGEGGAPVVCTTGFVSVQPNIPTAIAGSCEMSLDLRSLDAASACRDARRGAERRRSLRRREIRSASSGDSCGVSNLAVRHGARPPCAKKRYGRKPARPSACHRGPFTTRRRWRR